MTRPRQLVFGALGFGLLLMTVGGVWLARLVDPPGSPGAKVSVAIPPGTSAAGIAVRLERQGVVTSARVFRLYVRVSGAGTDFQAGEYELRRRMAMSTVLDALHVGPKIRFAKLVIPEGLTLTEIADKVGQLPGQDAQRFLELARSRAVRSKLQPPGLSNLEGLLFPDTYLVTDKEDEVAVLSRLVNRFDQVADEVGLGRRPLPAGLSPYQAVVAASLVEKEAKVPEDRPLIASVIENRLERGMKLQVDATVLYALGRHQSRVLFKDLEVDSPYNTYRVNGLPPTPIGAPGRASLEAVIDPANEDYIFYVLFEKNGKHAFAKTPGEFERLKAEARRKGVL
jgi:peptidoglycan lytic transglycosylase G